MGIKALLFDVDGVLLDSGQGNVVRYQELFRQIGGIIPGEAELARNNHLSVEAMLRRFYPNQPDQDIQTWLQLAPTIQAGVNLLKPIAGALDVIPVLAKKYKLGLVTNRLRSGIDELWKIVPYPHLFSAVAAYEDTEKHKPDAEPVRYVLSQLGIQPAEAIFVGDAQTDLEAGQAAGVDVVILGQEQWPGAKATIGSLMELPALLERW